MSSNGTSKCYTHKHLTSPVCTLNLLDTVSINSIKIFMYTFCIQPQHFAGPDAVPLSHPETAAVPIRVPEGPRPTECRIHPDWGAGRGSTYAGHSVGNHAEQWLYQWQDPGKSKAFVVTGNYLVICRPAKADTTIRLQKAVPQIVLKASHSQPTVPFPLWVLPPRNQNSSVSTVTKQRSRGPMNLGTNCHLLHSTETDWNLQSLLFTGHCGFCTWG